MANQKYKSNILGKFIISVPSPKIKIKGKNIMHALKLLYLKLLILILIGKNFKKFLNYIVSFQISLSTAFKEFLVYIAFNATKKLADIPNSTPDIDKTPKPFSWSIPNRNPSIIMPQHMSALKLVFSPKKT